MLNLSFMHIKNILYLILGLMLSTLSICVMANPQDGIVQPQTPGMSITSAPKQVPLGWSDITFNVTYPSRISGCSVYGSGSYPDSSIWVYFRKKGSTGNFTPAWPFVNNRTEFLRFYSCGGSSRTLNASLSPDLMLWGSPQEPGDYEFAVALVWQLRNNGPLYEDYSNIVTISIGKNNSAPSVSDIKLVSAEDTTGTIALPVSDPDDGDTHTFQIIKNPSAGSAWISDNILYYAPDPDWNGQTSIAFQATDSKGAVSNAGNVSVTVTPVNDPPVATQKTLTINEDTVGTVKLTATDIDSPPPSTFQIVTPSSPSQGVASISGSTLTFTPARDWNGTATLTYRAQDDAGAWSAPATVTIHVTPVNDPPVVADAALTLDEDTVGSYVLTAYDPDIGDKYTFEIVSPPAAAHGSGSIRQGNTLQFVPSKDWFGVTKLTYRARDLAGDISNTATVTITVNAVNDIPVVSVLQLVTAEDTPGAITLSADDIDSTPPFIFEIVGQPLAKFGTGSILGDVLTFNPFKDWNGTTSLTYRAQDKEGGWSLPATVRITVNPVNDVPALRAPLKIQTRENVSVTVKAAVTKQ
ncbi:tandem-95 repeat protein [Pseudomonas brenneri]|uniref:Ig-like domain-containing protein n=1 Tax=Pseudomonas brenneri TaxID=129817 RepID=UPI003B9E80EF